MKVGKKLTLITLAAIFIQTLPGFEGSCLAKDKELEAQETAALCSEKEGKWKKISWRSNTNQALADSQKTGKPLLIVLVVGEKAKKNASDC